MNGLADQAEALRKRQGLKLRNGQLSLAKEWFADNGLALNESKTQVMICTLG